LLYTRRETFLLSECEYYLRIPYAERISFEIIAGECGANFNKVQVSEKGRNLPIDRTLFDSVAKNARLLNTIVPLDSKLKVVYQPTIRADSYIILKAQRRALRIINLTT